MPWHLDDMAQAAIVGGTGCQQGIEQRMTFAG
jgi:hypothetical protein